jgi:hypothetical protein
MFDGVSPLDLDDWLRWNEGRILGGVGVCARHFGYDWTHLFTFASFTLLNAEYSRR